MGLSTQMFLPGQVDTVSKLRLPTSSVFPTDTLHVHAPSTFKDPRVARYFLRAQNQSPKYRRFNFLFLTTPNQKMRQLSAQLSPPMNLQFGFDSGACGNCHTPYSARCYSQTPKSGC